MVGIKKITFDNVSQFVKARVLYNPLPPFFLMQFCELPSATECDFHCVIHNTIVVIQAGELCFRAQDGSEFSGSRGCMFLLPAQYPYLWRTGERDVKTFQGGYLIPGSYDFSNLSPFLNQVKCNIIQIQLEEDALSVFEQELNEAEMTDFPAFHCSLALFRLLGRAFCSNRLDNLYAKNAEIQKYLHYIETRLHTDISIEELMNVGHVSRRKLFLLFNEHIGIPPLRYIAQQKIRLATKMIEVGNLGSGEIAKELGFSSVNYFIRFFRKHTGMVPSAMRRKLFLSEINSD